MAFIITHDHCLCCGSAAVSKVFTCTDHTVSHEQFDIWKCSNCTFRFTQNVPAADYIGRYYQSSDYVSHSDTKRGIVNRLYHWVRGFTLVTKQELVKKVTGMGQGTLLDIGAGTGAFANKMKEAGWAVTGLEPEQKARDQAWNNYSISLHEPGRPGSLPANTFDAITLWHVLEHVHQLHEYIEKFSEILKPAGKLLIAVPNYTSYDAATYNEDWAAYDVPRHLYHFSPKSIEVLFKQKGFLLEDLKPMWFDSVYVSMLSEKNRNGGSMLRALKTGLVSNMRAVIDKKKCSSIIYILRKK